MSEARPPLPRFTLEAATQTAHLAGVLTIIQALAIWAFDRALVRAMRALYPHA